KEVLTNPARIANFRKSRLRNTESLPDANLHTSQAPATASNVFPVTIASEVVGEPAVKMFTRNAPIKTPGQRSVPNINSAARAIPELGQTAVALGWMKVSSKANLPETV